MSSASSPYGLMRVGEKGAYWISTGQSSFVIETEGEPCWTVDGEEGPKGTIRIENLHNHLEIFVPFNRKAKTKSKYFKLMVGINSPISGKIKTMKGAWFHHYDKI